MYCVGGKAPINPQAKDENWEHLPQAYHLSQRFFEENCVRHVLSALSLQAIASFLEENELTTCSMLVHICTTVQLALLCVFLERELLDNKPSK